MEEQTRPNLLDPEQGLVIRPMRERDLPAISRLEKSSLLSPWSDASFLSAIRNPQGVNLVCEHHSRLIGYLTSFWVLDEASLTNIFVESTRRRKGTGTLLLKHLVEFVRERGVKRIFLEVREGNQEAIRLYQAMNFYVIGTRSGYYADNSDTALVMKLDL